ncbi:hypothetical protein CEXT_48421 [Caerostris extrusa]|uniref:Uncharacterized protein n=1 Tax=Caerostris extrusa TaxID=172846 RepID=A0AAV4N4L6_CAEEX|nr:hypothetical protein CEXT_48421 [Caerostris extrusa]
MSEEALINYGPRWSLLVVQSGLCPRDHFFPLSLSAVMLRGWRMRERERGINGARSRQYLARPAGSPRQITVMNAPRARISQFLGDAL